MLLYKTVFKVFLSFITHLSFVYWFYLRLILCWKPVQQCPNVNPFPIKQWHLIFYFTWVDSASFGRSEFDVFISIVLFNIPQEVWEGRLASQISEQVAEMTMERLFSVICWFANRIQSCPHWRSERGDIWSICCSETCNKFQWRPWWVSEKLAVSVFMGYMLHCWRRKHRKTKYSSKPFAVSAVHASVSRSKT